MATTEQVQVKGRVEGRASEVLTPDALNFVARLQREFGARRQDLLRLRDERQTRLDAGEMPQFLMMNLASGIPGGTRNYVVQWNSHREKLRH